MAHRPHLYSAKSECCLYSYPSPPSGDLGGILAGADKSPPAHFAHCANTLTSTILRGGG